MKSKILLLLIVSFVFFSCNENPQKNAEHKAKEHEKTADRDDKKAEDHATKAINKEVSSITHTVLAGANEAMAKVTVPKFKNIIANEQVKKIGNDIVNYVNAGDLGKSTHYQELLLKHLNNVDKAVAKKTINAADAGKIKEYAQNLASAVGL